MKTRVKMKLILSGILMAATPFLGGYFSTAFAAAASAPAADNDPNLTLPKGGAAAPMQAASGVPIVLKGATKPAAAASDAAGAEAPAANPVSAAAAVTAAPVPAAAPAPAPQALDTSELSEAEFKSYSYALKNVDGAMFDKSLNIALVPKTWRQPLSVPGAKKFTSESGNQYFEFGRSENGRFDVTTYNKTEQRATVTVFKDKKPESYTVVDKSGHYTATPGFCEILRVQTNSASFDELRERAVTCKSFYDRTKLDDSTRAALQGTVQQHFDAHRRNISLLKTTAAKDFVDQNVEMKTRRWYGGKIENPMSSVKPRAVLTADGNPEEIKDRALIAELGEACGRLWKNGDGEAATSTAKPLKAKGKEVKK